MTLRKQLCSGVEFEDICFASRTALIMYALIRSRNRSSGNAAGSSGPKSSIGHAPTKV
jgi:hypothetical protein